MSGDYDTSDTPEDVTQEELDELKKLVESICGELPPGDEANGEDVNVDDLLAADEVVTTDPCPICSRERWVVIMKQGTLTPVNIDKPDEGYDMKWSFWGSCGQCNFNMTEKGAKWKPDMRYGVRHKHSPDEDLEDTVDLAVLHNRIYRLWNESVKEYWRIHANDDSKKKKKSKLLKRKK